MTEKYIIERIQARTKDGKYLIKWNGYTEDYSTWEPRKTLMEDVPHLIKYYDKIIPVVSKTCKAEIVTAAEIIYNMYKLKNKKNF